MDWSSQILILIPRYNFNAHTSSKQLLQEM
jgi:hypothetical protein